MAFKEYTFKVYKIIEGTDNVIFVTDLKFTGIDRMSVDAKNKSTYFTAEGSDPFWLNEGPEYIKMRFGATYEGYDVKVLKPNLILKCSDTDLPEFQQDSGLWRIASCDAKKDAKSSNLIVFNAELWLMMNEQASYYQQV